MILQVRFQTPVVSEHLVEPSRMARTLCCRPDMYTSTSTPCFAALVGSVRVYFAAAEAQNHRNVNPRLPILKVMRLPWRSEALGPFTRCEVHIKL